MANGAAGQILGRLHQSLRHLIQTSLRKSARARQIHRSWKKLELAKNSERYNH